jgi:hypothetical protein
MEVQFNFVFLPFFMFFLPVMLHLNRHICHHYQHKKVTKKKEINLYLTLIMQRQKVISFI